MALGSWAEAVVRAARCPVVSVPQEARLAEALSTIVVGIDFSEQSMLVLEEQRAIGSALGCERFVLVHAHLPNLDSGPIEAKFEPLQVSLGQQGYRADLVAAGENAAELILRSAEDESADLIAVGTHSRRGFPQLMFGSVAEEVLRSARCPVYTARLAAGKHHE